MRNPIPLPVRSNRSLIAALVLYLGVCSGTYAQVTFQRTYGLDTIHDYSKCVLPVPGAGYYLAGFQFEFSGNGVEAVLLRINSVGDTLWKKSYLMPLYVMFQDVIATSNGELVVAGLVNHGSVAGFTYDAYLAKLDTAGNFLWATTVGGPYNDWALQVLETPDGGLVAAGWSATMSWGDHGAAYLVRLNSAGDTLWTRTYPNPNPNWYQYAYCVGMMPDSGFVLAGKQSNGSIPQVHVMRTNAQGDTLWTKRLDILDSGEARDVVITDAGNILITGYCTASGFSNPFLVELDPDGNLLWTRIYDHAVSGWAFSLCNTTDGYALFGITYQYDLHLINVDLNGDTIWSRQFAIGDTHDGYSVEQTDDGGFAMTGISAVFGIGSNPTQMFLIKTDAAGNVITSTHDIVLDPSFAVTLFPNPTTESATFQFTTLHAGSFSLRLHDGQGRVVRSLFESEHRGPGQYAEEVDLSGLARGSYTLVLSNGTRAVSVKVIKN